MRPPEHADRVAELVEGALELETAERINFLDAECDGDQVLRAEVESLLKFQNRAQDFIEAPAFEIAAETFTAESRELQPGQDLAGYTIHSLLGEGGMGEVYLAQDSALGRTVAIKLVKRAFNCAGLILQFRQEERILAGLNHPNIARLYGATVTEEGQPFFIMEYVEGERLDEYCRAVAPALRERLHLFRKICSAVSYAHRHLIIHRDLKPANVRVTPEGEPKLLDFGIATLLDEVAEAPAQTAALSALMTLDYASPEQVRGERMTTASDVYSLGVMLYELLTGAKPYRLTSRRPEEIARSITEVEPSRPSLIASGNRDSLRGDLDSIVLKAMEKESTRRYSSAAELSEDIRRHLENLPVGARNNTWIYRGGKFIKRNKIRVAAAALIAASLIVGILTTTWQARRAEEQRARAERRFQDLRHLADSLIFDLHDAVENLPGSTPARQLIVAQALKYLDSLAQEASDDPSLQRDLVAAYIRVGNVQGNPSNANLGDTIGAMQSYSRARALAEQLLRANAADAKAQRSLGLVAEKVGDLQSISGEIPSAVASTRKSLGIFKSIAEKDASVPAEQTLAISEIKMGDILGNPNLPNSGDPGGAMEHYRASLAILERLDQSAPRNLKTERFLGIVSERMGAILEHEGDIAEAEKSYSRSESIREKLAAENPENSPIVRDAAVAREKIANIMTAQGDLRGALQRRQMSLEIFERLVAADPKNMQAQLSLAVSYTHLADLLGQPDAPNLGRAREAIETYERALDILTKYADPADSKTQENLRTIRDRLVILHQQERTG